MYKKGLQGIENQLGQEAYDISFRLGDNISIVARKSSPEDLPTNNLQVTSYGKIYQVPVSTTLPSLRNSRKLLQREVEVLVGSPEEIRRQLSEEMQSDRMYVTMYFSPENSALVAERRAYLREQTAGLVKAIAKETIRGRRSYLEELNSFLIPQIREMVMAHIGKATNDEREIVNKYDNEDPSSKLRLRGGVFNLLTFGLFGRTLQDEVDEYAEREVAWRTLEMATNTIYKALEDDVAYLAEKNEALSGRIKKIASFYGSLSEQGKNGRIRMEKLRKRAVSLHASQAQLQVPDLERISSSISRRMWDVSVTNS